MLINLHYTHNTTFLKLSAVNKDVILYIIKNLTAGLLAHVDYIS
jgi:hypothetical protein